MEMLFKEINISGLNKFNAKTLEEKLDLFNIDNVSLRSEINIGLLSHLNHVTNTALTDLLVDNFKGFKWTREYYPEHHQSNEKRRRLRFSLKAGPKRPLFVY